MLIKEILPFSLLEIESKALSSIKGLDHEDSKMLLLKLFSMIFSNALRGGMINLYICTIHRVDNLVKNKTRRVLGVKRLTTVKNCVYLHGDEALTE